MGALAAAWHLLNLFAVAAGLGLLAPALAKLVWRRELRGASWSWLALSTTLLCAAVTLGGLVVFGRDGKMATYGAMVLVSALRLWWRSRGS
jgi:hypothetical protein